jgi:hypothetical protein
MELTMQGWHTTFLGMRELPRDISDFEMKAFSPSTVPSAKRLMHAEVILTSLVWRSISVSCV